MFVLSLGFGCLFLLFVWLLFCYFVCFVGDLVWVLSFALCLWWLWFMVVACFLLMAWLLVS